MSRQTFYIAIFIIIIATAAVLNIWQQRAKFTDVKIGENYYHLEIADTQAKREKGLAGRDTLAQNEGMIFLLPYPDRYSFWMKDMKFPIDIIWLQDNIIVDLIPTASPPLPTSPSSGGGGKVGEEYTKYTPRLPANRVIELGVGTISKENLKIGDMVGK